MKVLVVGAGVGGVAAALALAGDGHEVMLFEQGEQLRASGNGVIVWPNGTGILRDLGVALDELGTTMDCVHSRTADGFTVARINLDELIEKYGSHCMLVARGHLLERMAALLPDGMLRLNKTCTKVEQHDDGVVVTFSDGTTAEGDVLIGADGHRSVVRRQFFSEEPATYTGWASWHGITAPPLELAEGHEVQSFYDPSGLCGLHPVGKGLVHWVFEVPWQDGDPGAAEGVSPLTQLRARFGHWASPVPELLDSLADEDLSLFPHVLHRVPKRWANGRVTLAGDAVHVLPPRTAMGINQALEDSWVLRHALSRPGDPAELLRTYERVRRPRVQRLVTRAKFLETAHRSNAVKFMIWLARKGITLPTGTGRLGVATGSNYLHGDIS